MKVILEQKQKFPEISSYHQKIEDVLEKDLFSIRSGCFLHGTKTYNYIKQLLKTESICVGNGFILRKNTLKEQQYVVSQFQKHSIPMNPAWVERVLAFDPESYTKKNNYFKMSLIADIFDIKPKRRSGLDKTFTILDALKDQISKLKNEELEKDFSKLLERNAACGNLANILEEIEKCYLQIHELLEQCKPLSEPRESFFKYQRHRTIGHSLFSITVRREQNHWADKRC